jgi:hypothetical protein
MFQGLACNYISIYTFNAVQTGGSMSVFRHEELVGRTVKIVTTAGNEMIIDIARRYMDRIIHRLEGTVRSVSKGRLQPEESVRFSFAHYEDKSLEDLRFSSDIELFTVDSVGPGYVGLAHPMHRTMDDEAFQVSSIELV